MHIDGYDFGEITIDGKIYTSDVIIYKDKVDDSWRRKEGHKLSIDDIPQILAAKPGFLIVGTGAYGIMSVPDNVRSEVKSKGIEVIVEKTAEACDEYNKLANTSNVIAALHLTC